MWSGVAGLEAVQQTGHGKILYVFLICVKLRRTIKYNILQGKAMDTILGKGEQSYLDY